MTDVATSVSTPSQASLNPQDMASDTPENLVLSPSVREAIDRILPESASQLLHHRLPGGDGDRGKKSHYGVSKQNSLNTSSADGESPQVTPQSIMINSCSLFQSKTRTVHENGDGGFQCNDKLSEPLKLQKDLHLKSGGKRISRADLEVITAVEGGLNDSRERTGRRLSLDRGRNDSNSQGSSDSDDVIRPFAALREIRKQKRKKKNCNKDSEARESSAAKVADSGDEFRLSASISGSHSDSLLNDTQTLSNSKEPQSPNEASLNQSQTNRGEHQRSNQKKSTAESLEGAMNNSSKPCSSSDEISNNSFSSSKENIEIPERRKIEHQKLPKVKLSSYDVHKHKKKIRRTFPPTFVVIEQISALLSSPDSKHLDLAEFSSSQRSGKVLALSVRLEHLKKLCAKDLISCRQKKVKEVSEPAYKNIFEEMLVLDSEDDFQIGRRSRSLRKRDKTINYAEPTEADIFAEYSGRRGRKGKREPDDSAAENEEAKRRKLNPPEGEPTVLTDASLSKGNENPQLEYAKAQPASAGGPTEVVIYPKKPVTQDVVQVRKKTKRQEVPVTSSAISCATSTLPWSPSMSSWPVCATNLSTSLSSPVMTSPSNQIRPQFCMVKMDGKDVLLQVLPPSPGTAHQGSTLLLPGGKRLVVPPNHQLSQQIRSAPRLISPVPMPSTPLPVLSSLLPDINSLPAVTSTILRSGSMPLPRQPVSQQNRGMPSMLPAVPRTVTPVTVYPPTQVTVYPPTRPSITNTISTTASLSMAAPNSTTVMRNIRVSTSNLQAVVPNQSTGLRSFRIFVPGCQATGTPGRFATLGSIPNNTSALTRLTASSELLPQRKESKDSLSPEQRAERRRRLEKKYPLPPGVVIKTEPLDSPAASQPIVSKARSILPGNIQVLQALRRPGVGNVQSIRLINPAAAAATLTSGSNLPLTNVILRGATGGRQTFLIPSSLGMLTTNAGVARGTHLASSTSLSTQSSFSNSVVTTVGGSTVSILPTFTSSTSGCITNTTSSSTPLANQPSSNSSLEPSTETLPNTTSRNLLRSEQNNDSVVDKLMKEVQSLNKLLAAQEAMGLRGERLDKLKELLAKKEEVLKPLLEMRRETIQASDTESETLSSSVNEPSTAAAGPSTRSMEVIEID